MKGMYWYGLLDIEKIIVIWYSGGGIMKVRVKIKSKRRRKRKIYR